MFRDWICVPWYFCHVQQSMIYICPTNPKTETYPISETFSYLVNLDCGYCTEYRPVFLTSFSAYIRRKILSLGWALQSGKHLRRTTAKIPAIKLHLVLVKLPLLCPFFSREVINLLKPTGHVMYQQFNIQQLYALPTLYLCVLYLSENKQRLVPLTA